MLEYTTALTEYNGPVSRMRKCRQYRVHCFGAIPPVLSVLGYWANILVILEVQLHQWLPIWANYGETRSPLILLEGPSTQCLRSLVSKTNEGMILRPRSLNIEYWDPLGIVGNIYTFIGLTS